MAQVKGTLLLSTIKALRAAPEDVRAGVPPELSRYLTERVLVSNWYPTEDWKALLRILVAHFGGTRETWVHVGLIGAQALLSTVYQGLVRKGNARATLSGLHEFCRLHHDSGRTEVTFTGPGSARIELSDWAPACEELCAANEGYVRGAFQLAMDRDLTLKKVLCVCRGDDRCAWEVEW
jgi:hypothetical protein